MYSSSPRRRLRFLYLYILLSGNTLYWRQNYEALIEAGHEVMALDLVTFPLLPHRISTPRLQSLCAQVVQRFPAFRAWAYRYTDTVVRRLVRSWRPDVLLVEKGGFLEAETLAAARSEGVFTVMRWFDAFPSISAWREWLDQWLPASDLIVTADAALSAEANAQGISRVCYLPVSGYRLPNTLRSPDKQYDSDLAFIGSYYPERDEFLDAVVDIAKELGLTFKIWGKWTGWRRSPHRHLWAGLAPNNGVFLQQVYGNTKIALNKHVCRPGIQVVNIRTFEIPMCKAFQLVDHIPALESMFEIGSELITYSSFKELQDQIRYYIDHPEERAVVAERGRQRVLHQHLPEHRIYRLLELIEGRFT